MMRFHTILVLLFYTNTNVIVVQGFVLECKPLPTETWDGLIEFIEQSSGFADVCPFEISGSACPTPNDNNNNNRHSGGYVVTTDTDLYLSCDPYQRNSKCIIDCPTALSRHFHVESGASLTLENMILRGATNSSVWVEPQGRLSVFGTVFENNQALGSNNNENNTISKGGAIYVSSDSALDVKYSQFRGNRADEGGAIYVSAGPTTTNTEVAFCDFYQNVATAAGGAIAAMEGSSLEVDGCSFDSNEAADGGAIYAAESTSCFISFSTLSRNVALNGGALDYSGTADISDSTFTDNYAMNWGGAINCGAGASANLRRNTFANNGAQNNGPAINDRFRSSIISRDNSGCGNVVDRGWQCDGLLIWISRRRVQCRSFSEECVAPTQAPSATPSNAPFREPSASPSSFPTTSWRPMGAPTKTFSDSPSMVPSEAPSAASQAPTISWTPTMEPTDAPSFSHMPSYTLSAAPSISVAPSPPPSAEVSFRIETPGPTTTTLPIDTASSIPSDTPSLVPSSAPTLSSTNSTSEVPSDWPSLVPSQNPSGGE